MLRSGLNDSLVAPASFVSVIRIGGPSFHTGGLLPLYPLGLRTLHTSRLFAALNPLRLTALDACRLFAALYPFRLATLDTRRLFAAFYPLRLATLNTPRLFTAFYPIWLATFNSRGLFTAFDPIVFRITAIVHDTGISVCGSPLYSILTNRTIIAETVIEPVIGSADIVVAAGISGFIAVKLTRREATVVILANLRTIHGYLIAAELCAAGSTRLTESYGTNAAGIALHIAAARTRHKYITTPSAIVVDDGSIINDGYILPAGQAIIPQTR